MRSASTSEPVHRGAQPRRVEVAPQRLATWLDRYLERHPGSDITWLPTGDVRLSSSAGAAELTSILPLPDPGEGSDVLDLLVRHAQRSRSVALLLIRRGGYAVGVARDGQVVTGKSGTRYVQSRTAAGGWSQQRYARRRVGQARDLVAAAATAWAGLEIQGRPELVVTGGDKALAQQLLEAVRGSGPRSGLPNDLAVARHLAVPDPRRTVLADAAERVRAVQVRLVDA